MVRGCSAYLQVALDYTRLEDALRLATAIPDEPWIILEAGTPLIKSEGIRAVSLLKSIAGTRPVVADLKTIDTGRLEVALAYDSGADIAAVLAVAPEETIVEALDEASRRGKKLAVDLIGHPNPEVRAAELAGLGAHIVTYHIGIDVQTKQKLRASQRVRVVDRISKIVSGPTIAVAGGIKPEEAGELVVAGARIIVIGSAITRSPDPRRQIEVFRERVRPSCG